MNKEDKGKKKGRYAGHFALVLGQDYSSRKSLQRDSAGFEPIDGYFAKRSDQESDESTDSSDNEEGLAEEIAKIVAKQKALSSDDGVSPSPHPPSAQTSLQQEEAHGVVNGLEGSDPPPSQPPTTDRMMTRSATRSKSSRSQTHYKETPPATGLTPSDPSGPKAVPTKLTWSDSDEDPHRSSFTATPTRSKTRHQSSHRQLTKKDAASRKSKRTTESILDQDKGIEELQLPAADSTIAAARSSIASVSSSFRPQKTSTASSRKHTQDMATRRSPRKRILQANLSVDSSDSEDESDVIKSLLGQTATSTFISLSRVAQTKGEAANPSSSFMTKKRKKEQERSATDGESNQQTHKPRQPRKSTTFTKPISTIMSSSRRTTRSHKKDDTGTSGESDTAEQPSGSDGRESHLETTVTKSRGKSRKSTARRPPREQATKTLSAGEDDKGGNNEGLSSRKLAAGRKQNPRKSILKKTVVLSPAQSLEEELPPVVSGEDDHLGQQSRVMTRSSVTSTEPQVDRQTSRATLERRVARKSIHNRATENSINKTVPQQPLESIPSPLIEGDDAGLAGDDFLQGSPSLPEVARIEEGSISLGGTLHSSKRKRRKKLTCPLPHKSPKKVAARQQHSESLETTVEPSRIGRRKKRTRPLLETTVESPPVGIRGVTDHSSGQGQRDYQVGLNDQNGEASTERELDTTFIGGRKFKRVRVQPRTDMTPGVRRSKRARLPPIQPGEQIEYAHHWGTTPSKTYGMDLRYLLQPVEGDSGYQSSKRKKKPPRRDEEEENQFMTDPDDSESEVRIVTSLSTCSPASVTGDAPTPEDDVLIYKFFSEGRFSHGLLQMKRFAVKPRCKLGDNLLVGLVVKGKVVVKVNEQEFHVPHNSCFQIPPGSVYSISNLQRSGADVYYTVHKGVKQ